MSYLAIARKYRPSTFAEIIGQDHVTRTLTNAIRRGRIHHAYLFCGARGVGKTTAARALARALNCVQGPTITPCGDCPACLEILRGSSPDLIEIDGASNNSVDDVRELREGLHYAPTRGGKRIILIDEVHMLSKAAFNALLKSLEEPPPHVIFLFATTEPHKVLDTILSRVMRFDFKRIPPTDVTDHLATIAASEGYELPAAALRPIARASEGSMRDAQSLLDKVLAFAGDEPITEALVHEALGLLDPGLVVDFVGALARGEAARALEIVERVDTFGYEIPQFTSAVLALLRDATLLTLSEEAGRWADIAPEESTHLVERLGAAPVEQLGRLFQTMLEVHDQVAKAGRPRIVLDMAVVRLADTSALVPLPDLTERLEQLEQRLRTGGVPRSPTPPAAARPVPRPPLPTPATRPEPPRSAAPPKPVARDVAPTRPPSTPALPESAPVPRPPAPPASPPARAAATSTAPSAAPVVAPPAPQPSGPTEPAAPAPASPPADAVPGWSDVLQAIRSSGRPSWKLLIGSHVTPLPNGLRLVVDPAMNLNDQRDARSAVKEPDFVAMVERVLGRPTVVELGNVVALHSDPAVVEAERLRAQAKEDPAIARVVSVLQGTIVRVTPRGGP